MVKKLLLLCRNDNQLKLTDGYDNYIIIMEELVFIWDENKNRINKAKHGISFEEVIIYEQ